MNIDLPLLNYYFYARISRRFNPFTNKVSRAKLCPKINDRGDRDLPRNPVVGRLLTNLQGSLCSTKNEKRK
jgi:hypothetical protein